MSKLTAFLVAVALIVLAILFWHQEYRLSVHAKRLDALSRLLPIGRPRAENSVRHPMPTFK